MSRNRKLMGRVDWFIIIMIIFLIFGLTTVYKLLKPFDIILKQEKNGMEIEGIDKLNVFMLFTEIIVIIVLAIPLGTFLIYRNDYKKLREESEERISELRAKELSASNILKNTEIINEVNKLYYQYSISVFLDIYKDDVIKQNEIKDIMDNMFRVTHAIDLIIDAVPDDRKGVAIDYVSQSKNEVWAYNTLSIISEDESKPKWLREKAKKRMKNIEKEGFKKKIYN